MTLSPEGCPSRSRRVDRGARRGSRGRDRDRVEDRLDDRVSLCHQSSSAIAIASSGSTSSKTTASSASSDTLGVVALEDVPTDREPGRTRVDRVCDVPEERLVVAHRAAGHHNFRGAGHPDGLAHRLSGAGVLHLHHVGTEL